MFGSSLFLVVCGMVRHFFWLFVGGFVIVSGCLWEGSSLFMVVCGRVRHCFWLFVGGLMLLFCVVCVCLSIVMSGTYCVVYLFCFSSSCIPYVASFSELSIFDCPFSVL